MGSKTKQTLLNETLIPLCPVWNRTHTVTSSQNAPQHRDTQRATQMAQSQSEIKRVKQKKGKGRAEPELVPRRFCHFKRWSNIINGGLRGADILLQFTSPRPSHHYGGPSRIKIQSLLWLVWLRRATAQRRGLWPIVESPEAAAGLRSQAAAQTSPGHCWGFIIIDCDASLLNVLKFFF